MRAVRLHGKKDIRLDEIPEPQCGPDQIKVRIIKLHVELISI